VANRECPKCAEQGRDSQGDHLFLMEDGETWCCNKPYHPLYLEKDGEEYKEEEIPKMDKEEYASSLIKQIKGFPFLGNTDRCVSESTHKKFRVRTELSQSDRSPVAIHYPELAGGKFVGYKTRKLPKKFSVLSTGSGVRDYFGQHACPRSGKRLLICAGEEDTMAAYEMLKERYPEYDPCVVGLPRGETGSQETVAENLEFTRSFDEVILAMDMDDAGKQATAALVPILGPDTKVLTISEKDVGDMLVKGKQKEFLNAYFSAREYRPANIVSVSEILHEAVHPVSMGLSYPWPRLTELTYGLKQKGEIIGIGAAPGAGKSTIWQQIQKHLIFEHQEKIAVFDIEEGPEQGLKKLIGSCLNKPIHKPDCDYDIGEATRVGESLSDLVQFYGGDSENWDEVESAVRYFASKGVRFFFIDPLSALVEHLSASDGNTELGKIMRSMRKLRKQQGLTFFHANHLNNPTSGKEHGEGGKVLGSQFSGSRAQWKYSTLLMGFERNQQADDPIERNAGTLRVIKDRLGGNTGPVSMRYNSATGNLEQTEVELSDFIANGGETLP
jgi:twinkle protein